MELKFLGRDAGFGDVHTYAYFAKDDRSLTPESRDLLRTFGYSEQELDNFAEIDMVVSGQPQITFGK